MRGEAGLELSGVEAGDSGVVRELSQE